MLALIAILLALILAVLVVGLAGIARVRQDIGEGIVLLEDVKKLQLNPRTRIAQAEMRNRVQSTEDVGKKVGRVAAPHRVVVGGDEESQLNTDLKMNPAARREAGTIDV